MNTFFIGNKIGYELKVHKNIFNLLLLIFLSGRF